jgi:hypothetical protein
MFSHWAISASHCIQSQSTPWFPACFPSAKERYEVVAVVNACMVLTFARKSAVMSKVRFQMPWWHCHVCPSLLLINGWPSCQVVLWDFDVAIVCLMLYSQITWKLSNKWNQDPKWPVVLFSISSLPWCFLYHGGNCNRNSQKTGGEAQETKTNHDLLFCYIYYLGLEAFLWKLHPLESIGCWFNPHELVCCVLFEQVT